MGDLAVAHKPAVHVEVKTAVHTLKVQEVLHSLFRIHLEGSPVNTRGIPIRHVRGIKGNGIGDVQILGYIEA